MVTADDLLETLREQRLMAILRGSDAAATVATGLTLIDCGVECLEVSLTSAQALDVILQLTRRAGERTVIGAGTVIRRDDVERTRDAGAHFIVTPALSPSVDTARALGIPIIGGAFTPSEIVEAGAACAAVKVFPISLGGSDYLRAVRAALPDIPMVPVGGVDASSAAEYVALGALAVGVGSPLVGDAGDGGSLSDLRARTCAFQTAVSR